MATTTTTNFGTNAIVDERTNTTTDATYDSSATHDKVVGQMHVNNGKLEEKVGRALGKPEMEEKGVAKQAQGETEKAVGDSKKAVKEREKERDEKRGETEKERAKELAKVDKEREKELKKADKEAAKREKEARKLAEDREKAFAREHGNAVLTAAERQRWDDEHFAAYQRLNGPTTTVATTTVVLPGSVETIGEERRRMEEQYGLERKRYLEMREAEYRRVYGEVALSEAERHRWDFGYLVAYRQAHPEFYLADAAVLDEAARQAWVDEFELDTMRYELQRQRERQEYEHAREADFLRANGARELTALERQEWDAEHLAEYRRRSNNPGFMTPLATITPAVHTGAAKSAATTTSKANVHHTKHGVVTVGESRPGEAEYRVNPATGIAIQTETAVFTKDGKGSAVQHKTVDHPVVGTTVVDGVYVDNTHPATVVSTGAHDVQVGIERRLHRLDKRVKPQMAILATHLFKSLCHWMHVVVRDSTEIKCSRVLLHVLWKEGDKVIFCLVKHVSCRLLLECIPQNFQNRRVCFVLVLFLVIEDLKYHLLLSPTRKLVLLVLALFRSLLLTSLLGPIRIEQQLSIPQQPTNAFTSRV